MKKIFFVLPIMCLLASCNKPQENKSQLVVNFSCCTHDGKQEELFLNVNPGETITINNIKVDEGYKFYDDAIEVNSLLGPSSAKYTFDQDKGSFSIVVNDSHLFVNITAYNDEEHIMTPEFNEDYLCLKNINDEEVDSLKFRVDELVFCYIDLKEGMEGSVPAKIEMSEDMTFIYEKESGLILFIGPQFDFTMRA